MTEKKVAFSINLSTLFLPLALSKFYAIRDRKIELNLSSASNTFIYHFPMLHSSPDASPEELMQIQKSQTNLLTSLSVAVRDDPNIAIFHERFYGGAKTLYSMAEAEKRLFDGVKIEDLNKNYNFSAAQLEVINKDGLAVFNHIYQKQYNKALNFQNTIAGNLTPLAIQITERAKSMQEQLNIAQRRFDAERLQNPKIASLYDKWNTMSLEEKIDRVSKPDFDQRIKALSEPAADYLRAEIRLDSAIKLMDYVTMTLRDSSVHENINNYFDQHLSAKKGFLISGSAHEFKLLKEDPKYEFKRLQSAEPPRPPETLSSDRFARISRFFDSDPGLKGIINKIQRPVESALVQNQKPTDSAAQQPATREPSPSQNKTPSSSRQNVHSGDKSPTQSKTQKPAKIGTATSQMKMGVIGPIGVIGAMGVVVVDTQLHSHYSKPKNADKELKLDDRCAKCSL